MNNYDENLLKYDRKTDDIIHGIEWPLNKYTQEYMNAIRQSVNAHTRYEYALNIRQFIDYVKKSTTGSIVDLITLNKLESQDFDAYFLYMEHYIDEDGIERINHEAALKRKLTALRGFFMYLYEKGYIKNNEIQKVKMPKLHQKNIIYMENNEACDFLNAVKSGTGKSKRSQLFHEKQKTRDLAIMHLILSTGIRISECVNLNINDIDLNTASIRITRKGGNQDIVYCSDEALSYLTDYMQERTSNKKVSSSEHALFLSSRNTRISIRMIQKLVSDYAQVSVPLKHITPHKLRSTYGTNLYQQTGDIYAVAEALGHKDVNTTKDHYAHLSDTRKKENRNKVLYSKGGKNK